MAAIPHGSRPRAPPPSQQTRNLLPLAPNSRDERRTSATDFDSRRRHIPYLEHSLAEENDARLERILTESESERSRLSDLSDLRLRNFELLRSALQRVIVERDQARNSVEQLQQENQQQLEQIDIVTAERDRFQASNIESVARVETLESEVSRLSATIDNRPCSQSWQARLRVRAVETLDQDITLPDPTYPFQQRPRAIPSALQDHAGHPPRGDDMPSSDEKVGRGQELSPSLTLLNNRYLPPHLRNGSYVGASDDK